MRKLHVHFLPDLVEPRALAGATVVVIDVLRATTTLCHALASRATAVRITEEVDAARQMAAESPRDQVVLGGERGGVRIAGFDLGNSPTEYTPETVGGKTVVFTTTNGTRAMLRCGLARRMLLGAFVNRLAVTEALFAEPEVHLVCAGTRGEITREDVLLAGALVELQTAPRLPECDLNDQAALAVDAWQTTIPKHTRDDKAALQAALVHALASSQGGRNLALEGFTADIPHCAAIDRFDIVPVVDPGTWTATLAGMS